jgi:excisionase family DNA binding protein
VSQNEKLLTTTKVAEELNVTVVSVQRWIRQGHFPGAHKIGLGRNSPYRIPKVALEEFKEKQKAGRWATTKE